MMEEKVRHMEHYLFQQTVDVYNYYLPKMAEQMGKEGHIGIREYLLEVETMDEENRTDWEKRLVAEMNELRQIKEDINALEDHLEDKEDEIVIPEWIMDPLMRKEAEQLLKYANKYETIDIRDVSFAHLRDYYRPC